MKVRTGVIVPALVVVAAGSVYLLREATMSTHYDTGPDTRLDVEVRASTNRAEPGVGVADLAAAQLETCALEVARPGSAHDVRPVPGTDDRFAVTLRPALDSTDRKQYRGCVEDWLIDHVRLDVTSMSEAAAP